ncbi:unnamed protein product [Penicillium egyptiacum]|uniref:Carrier domain-containing protein n=1 Tax=Penicillium egyptiacum TaxID=1303716 RepID=A0A9W4K428_9EURO|nr:unnamed protein product [Penicillium egyptiacum]
MSSFCTNHDHLAEQPGAMPIAICGMGMRLPGGIRDSEALYDFLLDKRDARGPVPPDRFNIDGFYDSEVKPGKLASKQGCWLSNVDLSHFDSSLSSMSRTEIENLDMTRGGDEETNIALSRQDFGVDSLVSIELRNWWKQAFGADLTVLQLMNSGSFINLGQKAVDQLKQRHLKA